MDIEAALRKLQTHETKVFVIIRWQSQYYWGVYHRLIPTPTSPIVLTTIVVSQKFFLENHRKYPTVCADDTLMFGFANTHIVAFDGTRFTRLTQFDTQWIERATQHFHHVWYDILEHATIAA